jgi:Uma2 family endonuclease
MSMTPAEFDRITDFNDRYRYELIREVVVVSPRPGKAERDPNQYLGYLLLTYQETHPRGSSLDFTIDEEMIYTSNRRCADRAIWAGLGRLPDAEREVPTIAIEFVSPRRRDHRRDYEEKRDEYLAAGTKEYWIIDRAGRKMTVFRQSAEGRSERVITEKQTYETELLPGFVLPLTQLLARADLWPAKRRRANRRTRGAE